MTTAQLYNSAFAMQMDHGYPSPVQSTPSHAIHTKDIIDNIAQSCCEQAIAEANSHCSEFQNGDHACEEMADCTQSLCTNPVGAGGVSYSFDGKESVVDLIAIDDLLLSQKSNSLYRPPISR